MEPALEDGKQYPQNKGDFMHLTRIFFTLLFVASCAAPKLRHRAKSVATPGADIPPGAR